MDLGVRVCRTSTSSMPISLMRDSILVPRSGRGLSNLGGGGRACDDDHPKMTWFHIQEHGFGCTGVSHLHLLLDAHLPHEGLDPRAQVGSRLVELGRRRQGLR
jgi:hypothetical protein